MDLLLSTVVPQSLLKLVMMSTVWVTMEGNCCYWHNIFAVFFYLVLAMHAHVHVLSRKNVCECEKNASEKNASNINSLLVFPKACIEHMLNCNAMPNLFRPTVW